MKHRHEEIRNSAIFGANVERCHDNSVIDYIRSTLINRTQTAGTKEGQST
jgi:hypothetical protein